MLAETGRWSLAALICSVACVGIWICIFMLYFGLLEDECRSTFDRMSATAIEAMIGAAPIWARNLLLSEAFFKVVKKMSVRRRGTLGLVAAIFIGMGLSLWSVDGSSANSRTVIIIGASLVVTLCTYVAREACHRVSEFDVSSGLTRMLLVGPMDGVSDRAGWLAIVEADQTPQSTWVETRESRNLTHRQAFASSITRLVLWHWSQPLVYIWMLRVYRCYIASLGTTQMYLATVVAARELTYLCITLLALKTCPAFLMLDPFTVWNESKTYGQRCYRLATYLLTPHNYVAFCLRRRFRDSWTHRMFHVIIGFQVVADIASCFALGALMASAIQSDQPPTALVIGYAITASSFVLFFGPLIVVRSFRGAADKQRNSCLRSGLGIAGLWLLCALLCLVVLFAVLIGTSFNPYCAVWALQHDRCSNHGTCYGAGQCHCVTGYGPEISYSNEAMCSRPNMPCTGGQLARALESRNAAAAHICCSDRGTLIAGGCRCNYGYGPATPKNELTPAVPLCSIECYDPVTQTKSTCSGHGSCSNATNMVCKCDKGFLGKQCDDEPVVPTWFHSNKDQSCNDACSNHGFHCQGGVSGPTDRPAFETIMHKAGYDPGDNVFISMVGPAYSNVVPACDVVFFGNNPKCIFFSVDYKIDCAGAQGTRMCPCA